MEKTIFLKDVLNEMKKLDIHKNPISFHLKVRQYNRQTKQGGKVKIYENATLLQQSKEQKLKKRATNPNHWENRTRNIKLPNDSIEKIHILFIIEFNGQKVIY